MRVLITGDIHGNLPALEKLLHQEKNEYDVFVSHGDVVNYGPWSNECVQLLETLDNKTLLMGNHEENYLKRAYLGTHPVAKAFFEICLPAFEEFDVIKKYKENTIVGDFMVRHTIDDQYIFPDSDLSDLNLERNYIIGHSHYAFDREHKGRRIINTGSLGQNRQYINQANYVFYDLETNEVELRSFVYNVEVVLTEMKRRQYPEICINYYSEKAKK